MKNKLLCKCVVLAQSKLTDNVEKFRHFSFIIQHNKIIGYEPNKSASPLPFYPYYAKLHSEMNVYKKNRCYIGHEPFEIVNIRLSADGRLRNSMPCKCCLSFLNTLNCVSIWFSTDCGFSKLLETL